MEIQKTDWGYIRWMPELQTSWPESMQVGQVVIEPGKIMLPHLHYEEQFLYILEGTGTNVIDGQSQTIKPGDMFLTPVGCLHAMTNTGDTQLVHLLVVSPVSLSPDSLTYQKDPGPRRDDTLYKAIASISTQFLKHMQLPLLLFNHQGHVILQNEYFPACCEQNCHISTSGGACPCMAERPESHRYTEESFVCPYGLYIHQVPMVADDQYIGYLQGGYIFCSAYAKDKTPELYDMPESSIVALVHLLRKIGRSICTFCELDHFRSQLRETEQDLSSSLNNQKQLRQSLIRAERAVTDLKINNHFLFNTLNTMAAQALEGGLPTLYDSIVHLSKMFRYSVREQGQQVTLRQELEYLDAYLQLQKMRYQNALTITYKVDEQALNAIVPFHFLQPVVENAFTHGFTNVRNKSVRISLRRTGDSVEILLENNGLRPSEEQCLQTRQAFQRGNGHGLAMIYQKLQLIFHDSFSMDFFPGKTEGAVVRIQIPYREEQIDDSCNNL